MWEKSKSLIPSKISLWEWKEASRVKAFGRLSSKPMGDIRNFLRAEDSIRWLLIPSSATRTASYRHSRNICCMNEWKNTEMQRLRREGETGKMPGKLRVSEDEAAEGAEAADPWEEAGARAAGAGKAANTSLSSWLPGQRGPSCQATGHLRPRGPL